MKKQDFFISNFNLIKSDLDLDLDKIPSSYKRRMSNLDKISMSLFLKTYTQEIDEIVFSSIYGEFERLSSIIEQYQELNEVSPIKFSGSVHNFPVGNFCHINNTNVSYSAIASDINSISAGIIKSLISKNKAVLFCYADFMESYRGVSFIVSKNKINESSFKCTLEQINENCKNDEFIDICEFLENKKKEFISSLCKIERIN